MTLPKTAIEKKARRKTQIFISHPNNTQPRNAKYVADLRIPHRFAQPYVAAADHAYDCIVKSSIPWSVQYHGQDGKTWGFFFKSFLIFHDYKPCWKVQEQELLWDASSSRRSYAGLATSAEWMRDLLFGKLATAERPTGRPIL